MGYSKIILKLTQLLSGRDLEGCVLYAPLWHEKLQGSPFLTLDHNHHSCTVTGATWGPQGRTFDGVANVITIPDAASLRLTAPLTMSFWVYRASLYNSASAKREYLINKLNTNLGYVLRFEISDGRMQYVYGYGTGYRAAYSIKASWAVGWWHVTLVQQAADYYALFYVNGVLDNTTDVANSPVANDATSLELGYTSFDVANSIALNGKMGDVLLYNRALTAGEIMRNYLATRWRYQ